MKISIKDITSFPDTSKNFPIESELEVFELAGETYPITHTKPFHICLSMIGNSKLHITGETEVTIKASCDRCLSEVDVIVPAEIDTTVEIADGAVVNDDDIGEYPFVDGEFVDIDRLIYDEILVNYPAKILCQDDCKGLCPVCGQNKNLGSCGCDDTVLDPRMAQFLDVFNSFKEV